MPINKNYMDFNEDMSPSQKRRATTVMRSLMQNPIAKSSGAGALSKSAAEELGPKAVELRKKKAKTVSLPKLKREEFVFEREMSPEEMKKEKQLKAKYDESDMKANMIRQYGKEKGEQVYFAKIRGEAMKEDYDVDVANQLWSEVGEKLEKLGEMDGAKFKVIGEKLDPVGKENKDIDYDDTYNYIIETLVDAEFAEDYESAERMFGHMSEGFISGIVEEYLEEKARGTRKKSTVHAYDVDETLFGHGKKGKPDVKVHVKDESGKRVHSLTNQEFNTHKLKPGHSYDFSEFQSAKKFKETSTPNKKVVKDIKRKIARGHNVHLITARSKFDSPKEFHGHLQKHGIDIPLHNIHYTGGMKGRDIGDKKVKVANAIAKTHGASKVHMYDDAAKVHKSFEAEKKDKPTSKKIKTHMIAPDKSGESRVRSYQATKEEMSAYEYWKQFIK